MASSSQTAAHPASLLEAPGVQLSFCIVPSGSRGERLCCYGVSVQSWHLSLCRGRPGPPGWPCEPSMSSGCGPVHAGTPDLPGLAEVVLLST